MGGACPAVGKMTGKRPDRCYSRRMIEIRHLSKTFGRKPAIDDVSFVAKDGRVTGFLGPNGAGKSTTMRTALALVRPDRGQALIDGETFARMRSPMTAVGSVLNPRSAHKSRSAYDHLCSLAQMNGIPESRVKEVMDITGIAQVAKKKAGTFSLGMSQRLSFAAALLGDPRNLILDEPVNGLDPEGVKWVREICRYYASQGRAVLLSSHLMSEVALTADDLVIIGKGKIMETTTVSHFIEEHSINSIRVVTPQPDRLTAVLTTMAGASLQPDPRRTDLPQRARAFKITGIPLTTLADLLAREGVVMYEFRQEQVSLEDAYLALTHGEAEYRSRTPGEVPRPPASPGRGTPADGRTAIGQTAGNPMGGGR